MHLGFRMSDRLISLRYTPNVMGMLNRYLKYVLTAVWLTFAFLSNGWAEVRDIPQLMRELSGATSEKAPSIAARIRTLRAQSGSPAADLLLERGQTAAEARDFPRAVAHFTAAIDHAPEFAEAYHGRAKVFADMGRVGPAMEDVQNGLALAPDHFDLWYARAALFETMDRPKDAYAAYGSVLLYHPHHPEAKEARKRLHDTVFGKAL